MGLSPLEFREWQKRLAAHGTDQPGVTVGAVEHEAELHAQILDECNRRGWIVFHGSMAHRAMRTPGEPDFVILQDGGRTLLLEAKTRVGKLTADQLAIQAWARKLGHTIHVVRSLREFLEVTSP